jgi:hypothetical protein
MGRPAAVSDPQWVESAVNVIERIARQKGTVTAEDLRREFEPPEHANQIGNAFNSASSQKIIVVKEYRPSRDKSRNGGLIRVWELHPRMRDASTTSAD